MNDQTMTLDADMKVTELMHLATGINAQIGQDKEGLFLTTSNRIIIRIILNRKKPRQKMLDELSSDTWIEPN